MREINYLVVHCTATSPKATIDNIRNYWVNTLGWKQPGYHVIVKADGTAHELLPITQVSNGVKGHNHNSINISYIGGVNLHGKPQDTRTTAQKVTILNYLKKWREMFPTAKIQGHHDFAGVRKACPSFNAKKEYQNI